MVEVIINEGVDPGLDSDFFFSLVEKVVNGESKILGPISLVFGSDDWLLGFNIQYLEHDYYTDIITFDYCTNELVSGDLLISVERVIDNSVLHNVSRETEVSRVVIHGVLHLCGYTDKSDDDVLRMRARENFYLSQIGF